MGTKYPANNFRLFVAIICNAGILLTASATQPFSLYSVVEEWDQICEKYQHAKSQCDIVRRKGLLLYDEIDAVGEKYPFNPKAHTLKIGEFESERDFKERIELQKKKDAEVEAFVSRLQQAEIKRLKAQLLNLVHEYQSWSNKMEQVAAEWIAFTNIQWKTTLSIAASDIPYFDRETMSFKNIPSPFISHENEYRKVKFEVNNGNETITLKFKRLSDAETFKKGIMSGAINGSLVCYFKLGLPSDWIIKGAWTEKKTNWGEVGLAAGIVAAAACLFGGDYVNEASRNYTPSANDFKKKIEHPAIIGRKFPVHIGERKLIIKGSGAKSLGIEISSSSEGWKLEVEE